MIEKAKPLKPKEYRKSFNEVHSLPVSHESTSAVPSPPINQGAIQLFEKHAFPNLPKKVTLIEVGVGEKGLGPYQFAHALEKAGKDYRIIALDKDEDIIKRSRDLTDLVSDKESLYGKIWQISVNNLHKFDHFAEFRKAVNLQGTKLTIPKRWKKRIDYQKINVFFATPSEQADIVNATGLIYLLGGGGAPKLMFENIVDMVKPGGFLHMDFVPGLVNPDEPGGLHYVEVMDEESVRKAIDLKAYGLKLLHASQRHALFQKLE